MKKFLFLVSLTIISNCASVRKTESEPNVVNGVGTYEYPAVVQIIMDEGNGDQSACTGTFIKDDLLITAAHCIQNARTSGCI